MPNPETSAETAADLAGENASEVAPVGESDGSAANLTDSLGHAFGTGASSDASAVMSAANAAAEADPVHEAGAYRVMWTDHGGAAQTSEHMSAEFAKGLAIGLLRDGRNRDIVMVGEDSGETARVMTEDEVLAF